MNHDSCISTSFLRSGSVWEEVEKIEVKEMEEEVENGSEDGERRNNNRPPQAPTIQAPNPSNHPASNPNIRALKNTHQDNGVVVLFNVPLFQNQLSHQRAGQRHFFRHHQQHSIPEVARMVW